MDHLPIYRQIERYKRDGVKLSSSTINGWQDAVCNLLEPLYQTLKHRVLSQGYLQVDETPIQVLEKNGVRKKGKIPRWDKLMAYLKDGALEIDNNPAENAIRPIALGRKNYLFAGSTRGAHRAAMIYSFMATCKKHDVNPFEWLKKVLEIIPDHTAVWRLNNCQRTDFYRIFIPSTTDLIMLYKLKTVLMGCLFLFLFAGTIFGQSEETPDRKQNPLRMAGTFIAKVEGYYAKGIESSRKPLAYIASGDFDPEVYGMKLPFSFLASNRSFDYAQPFTRIGISPEYKWLRFHFGYRNISYSQYTLAGHSFLGAGLELNPGLFRFSALYGRFKKKTIPNTVNPLDTLIAPMRYGYAGKIGIGNQKNFVDLVFMHIKDDTLGMFDQSLESFKSPQSNVVGGVNMKISFMENLVFEGESAVSLLTKDLYALGFDEFGVEGLENIARLLAVNISSSYAFALRAALTYTSPGFSTGLEYRRVDPDFTSFGAHFFNTDLEHLTINTRFRAFEKKLNVRANIGVQNDNLKGNKISRSAKIIAMVAAQYNTQKVFSIDGSFSNYSINQKAGRLPLEDTIRLFQTNRSITLMPRLTFAKKKNIQQVIQWNLSRTGLIDHNPYTADLTEVTSDIAMMNYLVSFTPIALNLNSGMSYIGMHNAIAERNNYVVMLGFNKSLFKNKLNFGVNGSGGLSIVNDTRGNVFNISCSAMLKAFKKHGVKFFLHYQSNQYPDGSPQKSYQEFKTNVSYVYSI